MLLGEGEEAAAATSFAATGTEARIVDFDRLEDGLLGISCLGRERVRVVEAWREADGLNRGRVLDIAADPIVPVPPDQSWLKDVVRACCPKPATRIGTWSGATTRPGSPTGSRKYSRSRSATSRRCSNCQDPLERLAALEPAVTRNPG